MSEFNKEQIKILSYNFLLIITMLISYDILINGINMIEYDLVDGIIVTILGTISSIIWLYIISFEIFKILRHYIKVIEILKNKIDYMTTNDLNVKKQQNLTFDDCEDELENLDDE